MNSELLKSILAFVVVILLLHFCTNQILSYFDLKELTILQVLSIILVPTILINYFKTVARF